MIINSISRYTTMLIYMLYLYALYMLIKACELYSLSVRIVLDL